MWNAASSKIWTRVAVCISYGNNHYTTGTSYYDIIDIIVPYAPKKTFIKRYFSFDCLIFFFCLLSYKISYMNILPDL